MQTQGIINMINKIQSDNQRAYISGPISGYEDLNAPAFDKAEEDLKTLDFIPVNPLKIVDLSKLEKPLTQQEEWAYCMRLDIAELTKCGCLYMLPNWKQSKGAIWEFLNAKILQIPVLNQDFELINLTEEEYKILFYSITNFIRVNDSLIKEKIILK